ncbi:hypothetical protein SPI_02187 [Niveomyces insectorum RCEF 264]|uniref:Acetyltransferase n=1 Tax=Niveomyces insectorum RCEF 264 TaxID=1081102 RepID=A0A162MQT7_9HYPO|nr:hypothetical protein SPI_02187 [Niveomyces insectorum RCEF 264]
MSQLFTSVPRSLMVCDNVLFAIAAYYADWSHTHIFNPRWPPHAKFHNGQSMTFGALSALTAVYLLGRRNANLDAAKDSIFLAAVVGSLTTAAGLSAIFYPGTAWVDPEIDPDASAVFPMGVQGYIFLGQLVINWGSYLWEKANLEKLKRSA